MRTLLVVGIGMGEPEGLTLRAVDALARADVFFLLDKGEASGELVAARRALIARFGKAGSRVVSAASPRKERPALSDATAAAYRASTAQWHGARARLLGALIRDELPDHGVGAILVWGDPMLYDSTLRVIGAIDTPDPPEEPVPAFAVEVVPGITALQMLCAAHCIPVNAIGEGVLLTTGRQLASETPPMRDFAVLLDDGSGLAALMARQWPGEIWWGANLGTTAQHIEAGRLSEVGERILHVRAQIRAARGWVMDVWLARG